MRALPAGAAVRAAEGNELAQWISGIQGITKLMHFHTFNFGRQESAFY